MTPKHVYQSENSRTVLMVPAKNDEQCEKKFNQYLAAFVATLSALCMGTCLSWSSAAIPMLQSANSTVPITDEQGSWIGSLITLGACLGAIPAGSLAALLGPKKSLLLLALPLYLSWIIIAYCQCVVAFYAARFLAGIAIGGISVAAPMYVAELADASIRGSLGTFFQVQITIGLLIEYILGGTITNFKTLAQASSILPIVFVICFVFMPESPAFLCAKNDIDAARKSLLWFRGGVTYNLEDELLRISEGIKESATNKAHLSNLIYNKAAARGLIISVGLMVFQQLSGINVVLFYAGKIFSQTGSTLSPNTCAILLGVVQVVATLASTMLIEKAGRKILLFISSTIMCFCLLTFGVYIYINQFYDIKHLSLIPLISVAFFIITFSIGFGPIPWMIMGEIFDTKTKALASSISASLNWSLAFTVTNQFQNLLNLVGAGITFGIFGVICALGSSFVVFYVPETKGKTQEEVARIISGEETKSEIQKVANFSNTFV